MIEFLHDFYSYFYLIQIVYLNKQTICLYFYKIPLQLQFRSMKSTDSEKDTYSKDQTMKTNYRKNSDSIKPQLVNIKQMNYQNSIFEDPNSFTSLVVNQITNLKEALCQDNNINIGNLQRLNINFNTLLSYVRQGFYIMTAKIQRHRERINSLKQILLNYNIRDQSLEVDDVETEDNNELEELNKKIIQFIAQKNDLGNGGIGESGKLNCKKRMNRYSNGSQQKNDRVNQTNFNKKQIQEKVRFQYNLAVKFVHEHLSDKLEYDGMRKSQIQKNSILNLYLHFNSQNNQAIEYASLSLIQMALTNQLKKIFPNANQTPKSFQGLKFKNQFNHFGCLTDVERKKNEVSNQMQDQEYSPPLPDFDDD